MAKRVLPFSFQLPPPLTLTLTLILHRIFPLLERLFLSSEAQRDCFNWYAVYGGHMVQEGRLVDRSRVGGKQLDRLLDDILLIHHSLNLLQHL